MNNKESSISSGKKWIIILFVLLFAILLGGFIVINTYMEHYYFNKKVNAMADVYDEINAASLTGEIGSAEFSKSFRNICEKNSVDIIIMDSESKKVQASSREYEIMTRALLGYIFEKSEMEQDTVILEEEKYEIHRIKEPGYVYEYLDTWGLLDNGDIFLIRCPLEGIKDSVKTARTFLSYIIVALMLLLMIGIWVTWRRATISQLREQNIRLQHDIQQREKLEEMRSEFLSDVSHELKTPIALIQGYAEGLKENVISDEESKNFYCDVILDEASKMNQIVKKLLEINHMEIGETDFTYEDFNLAEVLGEYLQSAVILAEKKGATVNVSIPDNIIVHADKYYTCEAFNNYFVNAVNHVAKDMKIEVKAIAGDELVRVSVFNTGESIPEESLPHIWEKFYKVDKARTREYGGSGVGLSAAKAIMDIMKQKYGVNNYSEGVEFFFTLQRIG